jgi:hypothetical protein
LSLLNIVRSGCNRDFHAPEGTIALAASEILVSGFDDEFIMGGFENF